jgi:nicotinic acid phosphoribosyltransferase
VIDNHELEEVLAILEGLEDEAQAVELLKEFNQASSHYGRLMLNLDTSLEHEEWKRRCDEAQKQLQLVVEKIYALPEN